MNKKGITLIELMAVIALIAIIATIFFPNINRILNKSHNQSGQVQESTIIESTETYLTDHIGDDIDFDVNPSITIKLKDLVDGGYLTREPKEPGTGKLYDLDTSTVVVTKENNKYDYTLNLNTK